MAIKEVSIRMEKFKVITSKATPLDIVNVDTDQIIPKQFLKLVQRTGYGKYLFYDWRFDKEEKPKSGFILNKLKYRDRQILLTQDNFGSGSSREHAVWAILDYGFRAIIAPSFADIFYENCFKNGVLPIRLNHQEIEYLFKMVEDAEITIDLAKQKIMIDSKIIYFELDKLRKRILLEGLDEIEITLELDEYIDKFEKENSSFVVPAQ
jgi:3-isopropylmalate/(R)-2-methylmalate dehydratase small subunit